MSKREEIVMIATGDIGKSRDEVGCSGDYAWCAAWASTVLNRADIGDGVTSDSCTLMQRYMSDCPDWSEPDDWPIAGDYIFFDWDNNKKEDRPLDHVGICVGFYDGTIVYVNGNGSSEYYVTRQEIDVNAKGADGHNLVAYWMRYEGHASDKPPEYEEKEVDLEVRQLRKGMTGGDVKTLQRLLFADGYSVGKCGDDGDFGDETESAVKRYQKDHALEPDGIAGVNTLTALWKCEPMTRNKK